MSADIEQNNGSFGPQLTGDVIRADYLTRFQPGNRANPRGFPKGTPRVDHAYARLLAMSPAELAAFKPKNGAEEIALQQYRRAVHDDKSIETLKYAKEIADRTDGPVVKRLEVEQKGPESEQNGLLLKAMELISRLIEQRGITEAEARAILAEKAPTLAGYLEGEVVGE